MIQTQSIFVLSDVHYASSAEKARGCTEFAAISNPLLRACVRAHRHFIWKRDPFAHNHLLDQFISAADGADYVIGNGDYSCDSGFVGVIDEASCQSATECIGKLRARFGSRLHLIFGDHELGKLSLVGGRGGMRLASWERAQTSLHLAPFWKLPVGNYLLLGITSSLVAFPVFEADALPDERDQWYTLRNSHMKLIRDTFSSLEPYQRVILFTHDPTALPFLWREDAIRLKLSQVETTVIGHLHSPVVLWKGRLLSGMPAISCLGNSIRRMTTALNQAKLWKHFKVKLCPALSGIELLKDGGFCRMLLDPTARAPLQFEVMRLKP